VSEEALSSVQNILEHNGSFKSHVELRHQKNPNHLFEGIIQENDFFDLTMCNPPFHSSEAEAEAGSQRKWVNLSKETGKQKPKLNFGGKNQELIFPGGEVAFIKIMIEESQKFHSQCIWFTSLVSKKESLFELYQTLRKTKAINVKTIEMSQGQKTSRILAWTYLPESEPKKRKSQ
jgi:23S rRNA (adenine1618-N6)-methyltransferase